MIQVKTLLAATDKTAIMLVYCIKVLKAAKNRIAYMSTVVLICVNTINVKKFINLKPRFQKRFHVGTIHRALLIRTKVNFKRIYGIVIKYSLNNIVIVSKTVVPLSNRIYGPILREFCMR